MKILLDNRATDLVISIDFVKKHSFKLKKPIHIRNINKIFSKKGSTKHTVKLNIFIKDIKRE